MWIQHQQQQQQLHPVVLDDARQPELSLETPLWDEILQRCLVLAPQLWEPLPQLWLVQEWRLSLAVLYGLRGCLLSVKQARQLLLGAQLRGQLGSALAREGSAAAQIGVDQQTGGLSPED